MCILCSKGAFIGPTICGDGSSNAGTGRGSTAVSPWSSRSREGAPAAVPVTWDELESVEAANQFTLALAAERAKLPDPWTGYFDVDQAITPAMRKEVGTPDA